MKNTKLGILHPGAMGSALAKLAIQNGYQTFWASTGRSKESQRRAAESGITDLEDLGILCSQCGILLAVCPPHGATELAQSVASQKFGGIYIEANAIAPQSAITIKEIISAAGGTCIDGSIIGPPPREGRLTYLMLSGENLADVARIFAHRQLVIQNLGANIGLASAFKMCHTTLKKSSVLLSQLALAMAADFNIYEEFVTLWNTKEEDMELSTDTCRSKRRTEKAWRHSGEMIELGKCVKSIGLPDELCHAMATLYELIATNQTGLKPDRSEQDFYRSLFKGKHS